MKKYIPLSFSSIKEFAKSPNHFIYYKNRQRETTAAMMRGSALHCLVLEPDEFEKRYMIAPNFRRGTKAWDECVSAAGDREIMKDSEFEGIERMATAIMENRHARDIIQNATAFEQHVEFEFNGIPFHGFIDIVGNVVADLKSTQDVSASGFNRFVFNYNYHWQAALYLSAIGYSNEFMFIGIEANAPHNVMVYRLPQSVIDIAVRQLIEVTNEFKKWDGLPATYNNEIIDIQPPSWM